VPLDIQPPNFGGLAGLAGTRGGVELTNPGALGLQGLQINNSRIDNLQKNRLQQQQLLQQGQSALMENANRRNMANIAADQVNQQAYTADQENQLGRDRLAEMTRQAEAAQNQTNMENAAKNALMNRTLDISESDKKTDNALNAQKAEWAKLLADKKEAIHAKGAQASYGLMAMNNAKTPEEANMARNEIIKDSLEKGYLSKDQVDTVSKLPLSQFKALLGSQVIQFGAAKEMKDVMDAQKSTTNPGDVKMSVDAAGNMTYTKAASKPEQGKLEADLVGADDSIREIKDLVEKAPSNFFGAGAVKQDATWYKEWGQNIPLVGKYIKPSDKDKSELSDYSAIQSQVKNQSMNIIKTLSGLSYTDKQLEFMNEIVPALGKGAVESEFRGKGKNLLRYFEQLKQNRANLLAQGIPVSSPEYESKMRPLVDQATKELLGNSVADKNQALRQYLLYKGHSMQEINKELGGQ